MKTAIIVPTYNRPTLVARMLDSLSQCHIPDDVEVIVVENGMRSGTEQVCRERPLGGRLRYLFVEQAGRSLALNTGMRESNAEFLIFFDDDLRFAPDIVGLYISAARKYGPGHFFGGPLIADAEVPCSPHLLPHLPASCRDWAWSHDGATIALSDEMMFFGANWAGFRTDIEQVGNFSEAIGVTASKLSAVGEETLMQRSMLEAGMNGIYIHDAAIYHLVPKECYTVEWIRNRKMRHGVTDYILDMQTPGKVRTIGGMPAWALSALAREYAKAMKAALTLRSLERRTAISMRISYLRGMLLGAFMHRAR